MENAARVNVVPVEMGWDDIGSWSQLHAVSARDVSGNATVGDVIEIDCANSYLRSDGGLVAAVGLKDIVVVRTGDATLVADMSRVQDVKRVVDGLKAQKRPEPDVTTKPATGIKPASERLVDVRHWMFDIALPFWAKASFSPRGFVTETLNLNGSYHARDETSRLRVTARQIYVFAHAKMLGWNGTGDTDVDTVLDRLFTLLTTCGSHSDGGFVHLLNADGSVHDDRRDTYDHAFVLLALAYMTKATGRSDAAEWFARTLAYLDETLADNRYGGFLEGMPRNGTTSRTNPHMHLLETWLAAHDLTGDAQFLQRADRIIDLFDRTSMRRTPGR